MAISTDVHEKILAIVRRHFRKVDDSGTFSLNDFLHGAGRAADACLYLALFCPPLVECDGSVLLGWSVEEPSDRKRFVDYRAGKGRAEAERSFNFVEVPYLFSPGGRNLSDDEDHTLAEAIAASWRAWLRFRYPEKAFVVEVLEPGQTGSVVGIHFYEASIRSIS